MVKLDGTDSIGMMEGILCRSQFLGLTHLEVEKRREMGEGGNIQIPLQRTKAQILKENIFTLFNLLNFIHCAYCFFSVGSLFQSIFYCNYFMQYWNWNCTGVKSKKISRRFIHFEPPSDYRTERRKKKSVIKADEIGKR